MRGVKEDETGRYFGKASLMSALGGATLSRNRQGFNRPKDVRRRLATGAPLRRGWRSGP